MVNLMKVTNTVYPNGSIRYHNEHGYLHREDGPAIIGTHGYKAYWLNGIIYEYEEWLSVIPNPISVKWREYCETN